MFGWLVLIFGIVYGYMTPGRQNKMDLFKTAIIVGLIVGIVFGLIGWATGINAVGFGGLDIIGIIVSAIIIAILFVVGAWVGDFLEDKMKSPRKA